MLSCTVQLEEEEEAKDSFDVDVAVTNPEKVGQLSFFSFLRSPSPISEIVCIFYRLFITV